MDPGPDVNCRHNNPDVNCRQVLAFPVLPPSKDPPCFPPELHRSSQSQLRVPRHAKKLRGSFMKSFRWELPHVGGYVRTPTLAKRPGFPGQFPFLSRLFSETGSKAGTAAVRPFKARERQRKKI